MKLTHILLGILVLAILYVFTVYNGFVSAKETVDEKWAQIETQYQRRADLIPNLVSTVKGAASFEKDTFLEVTEARTKWLDAGTQAEKREAMPGFDSAISRLLLVFENYPNLTAVQTYRNLMTQLEGTENRIGLARRNYNDTVREYNIRIKRVPGKFFADLFGFTEEDFFESEEGSDAAPVVDFDVAEPETE